jgi:hypothetical protein
MKKDNVSDLAIAYSVQRKNRASGRPVGSSLRSDDSEEHYSSIADAILAKKRKASAMADGGMVDLDENAMEGPDAMDELNVLGKENYSEDSMLDEPKPMDRKDIVGSIRRRMKSKAE